MKQWANLRESMKHDNDQVGLYRYIGRMYIRHLNLDKLGHSWEWAYLHPSPHLIGG